MSSLRCKMGIHNWQSWRVMITARDHQQRKCWRCGFVEVQQIVASGPPPTKSFDEEQGWCTDINCLRTEPHAPHDNV